MIGRGALGNPFIFEEIKAKMKGEAYDEPTPRQRVETALCHTRLMIEDKGEKIAIPESRKHVSWYLKGLRGNAPVRVAINHATMYDELEKILNDYATDLAQERE